MTWPVVVRLSGAARPRERDRRLRYVARHPQQVNTGDIARLLSREVGRDDCDLLLDRAAALGIRPWTMYSWVQRFDVPTLAVVLAAELPHRDVLSHLADGVLPDLGPLRIFAAINGLPTAPSAPVRRAAPGAATTGPPQMPPIFEPGSWPYDQFGSDLPQWPESSERPGEPPAQPGPMGPLAA